MPMDSVVLNSHAAVPVQKPHPWSIELQQGGWVDVQERLENALDVRTMPL